MICTVYWEIFALLNFQKCHVSLCRRKSIAMTHLSYWPRGSFAKIVSAKSLKFPFLRKFHEMKVSQYIVSGAHEKSAG